METSVMQRFVQATLLLLLMIGLAACAQDDPAAMIEAYLQARVASDADVVRSLSCAAWEAEALAQADSFSSMNAELQDMACRQSGQDGDQMVVECDGKIVTTYANGETREWELGRYLVVREDGEWRMCGEAP
jgi:hypothetical protein